MYFPLPRISAETRQILFPICGSLFSIPEASSFYSHSGRQREAAVSTFHHPVPTSSTFQKTEGYGPPPRHEYHAEKPYPLFLSFSFCLTVACDRNSSGSCLCRSDVCRCIFSFLPLLPGFVSEAGRFRGHSFPFVSSTTSTRVPALIAF